MEAVWNARFNEWDNMEIDGPKCIYEVELYYVYRDGPPIRIHLDVMNKFGERTENAFSFDIGPNIYKNALRYAVPIQIAEFIRVRPGSGWELADIKECRIKFQVPVSQNYASYANRNPDRFVQPISNPLPYGWYGEEKIEPRIPSVTEMMEERMQRAELDLARQQAIDFMAMQLNTPRNRWMDWQPKIKPTPKIEAPVPMRPETRGGRKIILLEEE